MAKLTKSRKQRQRLATARKIKKLQKSGLISSNINPYKKPSQITLNKLSKYKGVISGKQEAVRVSSAKKAKEYRDRIGEGGSGRTVIVPREKGERFRVTKGDKITSTRKQYGQTIHKTIGDKFTPPKAGERAYYTLPTRKRGLGKLKRKTFASFDEMLFYLNQYEINFEDIEDYIEVEKTREGSALDRRVRREYTAARNRLRKKRKKKKSVKKKSRKKSGKRK